MKISLLSLFTFAPLTAFGIECSNEDLDHDPLAITPAEYRRSLSTLRTRALTQIDAYVHVLVSKELDTGPKALVQKKIDTLNSNFKPWGYHFNLQDVDTTVNADWAAGIDNDKQAKTGELHKGNYQTLNVYMVEGAGSGLCSPPAGGTGAITQANLTGDGCFVPWGPSTDSSTLTHEVGHWMGLRHVFQGGCDDGDGCDDTAPQDGPSYAKMATPGDLNSCPAKQQCSGNGKQNVKNFMDYSDCSQEFTPCQGGRMDAAFTTRRKGRKVQA
ncbi:pregnancy-associated plasma protein-A-domain-containing protein [Lophiotrema nucula]|uniref:Pregnancy-associated plasma protein-A-domain-containing protein n=1 Tax=Lophiotrema nucula TaxID=690887 RepID=A0A6A5ZEY5_9PLEO|nr:pregnancy-associated plasma protein-A-domain-containing protein [Lophiotrema nucula]